MTAEDAEMLARWRQDAELFKGGTVSKMARFGLGMAADLARLRGALEEIKKGRGAFSADPLEHAGNCIDEMKAIARTALLGEMT